MRACANAWIRVIKGLPLAVISLVLLIAAAAAMAICDLARRLVSKRLPPSELPKTSAASIVIPNWNGRDLLEKYLPSVVLAAERIPGSEVIVVENGSTDGSADFVREHFPQVRLLALKKNLGFGGGSNAGFRAAKNDIVVLLNSDMRVEPDFLQPLLEGFTDELVFSVSCQIFFSDPKKVRQETGLTETWWKQGSIRVRHRDDPQIQDLYPCAYGGGGSCAYDRRKFFELGGFDELLRPFYLEDTDLGYLAWKRGWKTMYQPKSIVYHEHRGTIGRRFTDDYIQGVLKKNFILFAWKNIHDWRMLSSHLFFAWASSMISWLFGDSPERSSFVGIARAAMHLGEALHSRWRAIGLAAISDKEALRRPLGGYFRDTFHRIGFDETTGEASETLRVLFVSPYPIYPPTHGGAVFMYQTVVELARLCQLHALILLDYAHERAAHAEIDRICASTEYFVRLEGKQKAIGSLDPHAVREFSHPDVAWMIHRQIYTHKIDLLQLEYTPLAQYAGEYRHIACILFEHDVYFQSIARRLPFMSGVFERLSARWEYLRALRYELRTLPKMDRVQVCSRDNADYLISFLPQLKNKLDAGFRAGVNTTHYNFQSSGREPMTMLFLGNFRHPPNQEALEWFTRLVLPKIIAEEPSARLIVVGAELPPKHWLSQTEGIELVGFVDDIRDPLARYSVFLCPILSGSGVRVKLLEAFAAGIPVVSTRLGAEGLARADGEICALADDPESFAQHVLALLRNPGRAQAMAERARAEVVAHRDIRNMTERLVECYRAEVARKRKADGSNKAIETGAT